ncbi:hypothetical protein [Streptomyces sp. NPDC058695]|uniref:hypothetical protein n=1 Tax=Streptomyces sp. NPDC058695 TaxID=3346604 RepID=UPI00364D6DC8
MDEVIEVLRREFEAEEPPHVQSLVQKRLAVRQATVRTALPRNFRAAQVRDGLGSAATVAHGADLGVEPAGGDQGGRGWP